ncbi:MAG: HAMP domain-containing histidine kinase [Polyangiaceae bacterium]|nr:HAMP domain-containing histidine kinase [Polyangiaceae bacterium]
MNPTLDLLRTDAMRRAAAPMAAARWAVMTILLGVVAVAAWLSPSPLRTVLFVTATLLWLTGIVYAIARRAPLQGSNVPRNLTTIWAIHVAAYLSTGGAASPLAFGIPLITAVLFLLLPRHLSLATLAIQVILLWRLNYLPLSWRGESFLWKAPTASPGISWVDPLVLTVLSVVAARIGVVVDGVIRSLFSDLLRSREQTLAEHQQTLQDLTALTGEVAHELKNPLASIKGLAGLIAKDLTGKSAERMDVMRREIERMRSSLDELLGLSRPLGPLALETVCIVQLAVDVVRLHEGMAADRGVIVSCLGRSPLKVECDPHKIKQILTNLIQNALDAAPPQSVVAVQINLVESTAERPASVRIQVLDRGDGIKPGLSGRLFQRGATDKAHGSGIGLTLARTLARQHGGDLTLENHPTQGAVATLQFPITQPVTKEKS